MDDFQRPIGPKDPYEKIHISEITKKKEEEKEGTTSKTQKKGLFALAVLSCIKKVTKFFTYQERKIEITHDIAGACRAFKEQLQRLEKENLSEDDPFVEKLSNAWQDLVKAYELDFLKKQQSDKDIEQLINEVNNYYGEQEFPLGYYLLQYKKGSWHPFPYIYILKRLHKEYNDIKSARVFQREMKEVQGKLSTLEGWINLLDKIA